MKRCIFIEEPRDPNSVDQVAEFGKVVVLFERGMRRPGVMDVHAFTRAVCGELELIAFDPDADMIVMTGSFVVLQFTILAALSRYTRLKLLTFHAPTSGYVVKEFDSRWCEREKDTAHAKART